MKRPVDLDTKRTVQVREHKTTLIEDLRKHYRNIKLVCNIHPVERQSLEESLLDFGNRYRDQSASLACVCVRACASQCAAHTVKQSFNKTQLMQEILMFKIIVRLNEQRDEHHTNVLRTPVMFSV